MLNRTWEYDDLFKVDRLIFSALFIVVCARRFASIRDVVSLIRELALVLLALLLGYASSLYPWYITVAAPDGGLDGLSAATPDNSRVLRVRVRAVCIPVHDAGRVAASHGLAGDAACRRVRCADRILDLAGNQPE